MNKIFLLITILSLSLYALEIPIKHAKVREFGKSLELNAQIVQLSNAKQAVMSILGGHIEKYYVKIGQSVKKGQKIVLIESIALSKMTAEYISLTKQLSSQEKNYNAIYKLYQKGMTSMQEVNEQSIKKDELLAKLTALKSQLHTLGVDTNKLTKASSNFILYAHSDGIVSDILQALHSSIKEDTPIISLVKSQAFYLKSYLPLEYASKIKVGQKIVIKKGYKNIVSYITQILPYVDENTQRIILLSNIDEKTKNLYIDAYTSATLYFDATKSYVSVEKSALSFFNNEWVVFVPKDEEHEEHEEHGENEEHEIPYEVRVVKIIAKIQGYVAVEGLSEGEEYISDKSYYVKSILLKSSLGGHGH